jgi:hypothetical protein
MLMISPDEFTFVRHGARDGWRGNVETERKSSLDLCVVKCGEKLKSAKNQGIGDDGNSRRAVAIGIFE